jgi:two-component system chemotaxis response regulator CheB
MNTGYTLNRPTSLTCPECGGAVASEHVGTLRQYRCHIGHVLTAETMLVASLQEIETKLASCLAHLNEHTELCRQMAEQGSADGEFKSALEQAAGQTRERAEAIRDMLQGEWIQPLQFLERSELLFR